MVTFLKWDEWLLEFLSEATREGFEDMGQCPANDHRIKYHAVILAVEPLDKNSGRHASITLCVAEGADYEKLTEGVPIAGFGDVRPSIKLVAPPNLEYGYRIFQLVYDGV